MPLPQEEIRSLLGDMAEQTVESPNAEANRLEFGLHQVAHVLKEHGMDELAG